MSDSPHPTPSTVQSSESSISSTARGRRRGRWRWLVAFGATVAFVVAGSGLVAFAQSGGGPTAGPSFLPADTSVYLEVRADLPSGQEEALVQMLSAFPGFADTATFDMKVGEALEGYVAQATNGLLDLTTDLRSWFDGQISLGVFGLEEVMASGAMSSGSAADLPFIAGLSITDPDALEATIAKLMGAGGSDVTENVETEEHQGTSITVTPSLSFAVLDDLVIASTTVDRVKLGLDVLAGEVPSLASDPGFQAAFARVPDAHLHAGYVDFSAFEPLIEQAVESAGVPGITFDPAMLETLPVDATWYVAVRPDGATLEILATPGEGSPPMTVGESTLAESFPATTQAYLEIRQLGPSLKAGLEQVKRQFGEQMGTDLESIEATLGTPLEDILSWADDASLGVALDSGELWVGLAADVSDTEAAQERVDWLLGLVSAIAIQSQGAVTVTTDDATGVTTIDIDPEMLGGQMPVPIQTSVSVALDGDRLLMGTGSFVSTSMGLTEDDSLASQSGYADAVTSLGIPNAGYLYVDITGIRTAIEPILGFVVPEYADMAPWIEPFDRVIAGGTSLVDETQVMSVQLFLR